MRIHYLEIVTPDVDAVCSAYTSATGSAFGAPDTGLGNARTATMPGGGIVGVRAPMAREREGIEADPIGGRGRDHCGPIDASDSYLLAIAGDQSLADIVARG